MGQEQYESSRDHLVEKEAAYEASIVSGSREMRKKAAVEWCLKMKGKQCRDCDNNGCDFNFEAKV